MWARRADIWAGWWRAHGRRVQRTLARQFAADADDSPRGHVREVARLSILLAVVLGFPVLMVLPLVTLLLVQVAGWTDLILKILLNAAAIAAAIVAAIVVGSAVLKEFTKKRPPPR